MHFTIHCAQMECSQIRLIVYFNSLRRKIILAYLCYWSTFRLLAVRFHASEYASQYTNGVLTGLISRKNAVFNLAFCSFVGCRSPPQSIALPTQNRLIGGINGEISTKESVRFRRWSVWGTHLCSVQSEKDVLYRQAVHTPARYVDGSVWEWL